MNAIQLSDMLEANGKSIRENNLALIHDIPIGTIVEITHKDEYDADQDTYGLRLFVVHHSRDCDGTPLYSLSFNKDAQQKYEQCELELKSAKLNNDPDYSFALALKWGAQGAILSGYPRSSIEPV